MHYMVCTMRAAAVVLQPKALFVQRKVPQKDSVAAARRPRESGAFHSRSVSVS
jgi:hypothetical protein